MVRCVGERVRDVAGVGVRWDLVRLGMEARRREEFMSRMKRYEETLWQEELVSKEEARVWLARCRATLIGGTLSSKLIPIREKEER